MILPGFVTSYRDNDGFVHLYFFPGINNLNNRIYKDIDVNNINMKYTMQKNIDNSIDYKFFDKNIIKLHCKLITTDNKEVVETLNV